MATKRKPRRKTKAPTSRAPATRKPRKARPADPLDGFIDAAAQLLGLPVQPQWRAAIKANLEVNLRMASFVAEFALPDETEPAPIFAA
jgi:hypothetical protein